MMRRKKTVTWQRERFLSQRPITAYRAFIWQAENLIDTAQM
jgi:hypothetical protein